MALVAIVEVCDVVDYLDNQMTVQWKKDVDDCYGHSLGGVQTH